MVAACSGSPELVSSTSAQARVILARDNIYPAADLHARHHLPESIRPYAPPVPTKKTDHGQSGSTGLDRRVAEGGADSVCRVPLVSRAGAGRRRAAAWTGPNRRVHWWIVS